MFVGSAMFIIAFPPFFVPFSDIGEEVMKALESCVRATVMAVVVVPRS